MPPQIRIELFGELRITQGDIAIARFPTQKAAALLACLACHQGKSHSREALAAMLWGESEAASARNSLSTALWSLRRILNPQDDAPDPVLFTDRTSVSLVAGAVSTDVAEFEDLIARAERASSASERMALYEQGLSLRRAPLLSDFYEDWVAVERERLESEYASACQRLAQLYVEAGGFEDALKWARQRVQVDPFHEEARLSLMQVMVSAKRAGDAVLHYQEMERLFQKELNASPSENIRQYAETIRESLAAPSSLSEPSPPSLSQRELAQNAALPTPEPRPIANPKRGQRRLVFGVAITIATLFVAFKAQNAVPNPAAKQQANAQATESRSPQPKIPQAEPSPKTPSASAKQEEAHAQPAASPTTPPAVFTSAPLPQPKLIPAKFPSEGKALWAQRYQSLDDERDSEPSSMKTDADGNLYIGGFVQTLRNDVDFLVVKYSADGKLLWRRRWNGPGNDCDRARCIALDSQGAVYVAGESYNGEKEKGGKEWDIALVKFDANGVKQWERLYNGGKWDDDRATGVCVDAEDKVYLGGVSRSPDRKSEYVLLKYDADGRALYPQPVTYNPSAAGHEDVDIALEDFVVDAKGSLYLAAHVGYTRKSGDDYCLFAKYDYHGNQIWMRRFSGEFRGGDKVSKIALDGAGNVFCTGTGYTPRDGREGTGEDIFVVKYDAAGNEIWKTSYRDEFTPGVPDGLAIDSEGNALVSGTIGAPQKLHVALKFTPQGKLAWKRRYPTYGSAYRLQGVVSDSTNSVYVIGKSCDSGAPKSAQATGDMVATKYSPGGDILWQRAYLGPTDDQGRARALLIQKDPKGNIFSAGQSPGGRRLDIVVVKYSP